MFINGVPITDGIGSHYSLKMLSKRDPGKAMELLRSRYYVLLTRAIKGTDIFFEDPETGRKVKADLESIKVQYGECEPHCMNKALMHRPRCGSITGWIIPF